MIENNLLSLIIFAPLFGAVINWVVGKRQRNEMFSGAVACGAVAISCIVAFMIAFGIGTGQQGALFAEKPVLDQIWTWVQVGNFRADFGLGNGQTFRYLCLFCYICRAFDPYFCDRLYARR